MQKPTVPQIEEKLREAGVEFDSVAFAASIEMKPGSIVAIDGSPIEIREVTDSRISGRVISMASWARAHIVMKTTNDPAAAREVLDFGETKARSGKCRLVVNGPVWRFRFTSDSVMLTNPRRLEKDCPTVRPDFLLPLDWIVAIERDGKVKTIMWSKLSEGAEP